MVCDLGFAKNENISGYGFIGDKTSSVKPEAKRGRLLVGLKWRQLLNCPTKLQGLWRASS
jgi:hypothetical protein